MNLIFAAPSEQLGNDRLKSLLFTIRNENGDGIHFILSREQVNSSGKTFPNIYLSEHEIYVIL